MLNSSRARRACGSRSNLVYSAAAGLFVVPIFAAVQAWAGEDRRARVVGAVNALNYIWMVGGSLATMVLLELFHLSEPMALAVLGVANIAAAIYLLPPSAREHRRLSLRALWRVLFRLEVVGRENLGPTTAPNVLAINHVSWLDAPIVYSLMDPPPLFAVESALAKSWAARFFLRFAEARAVDPIRPLSLPRAHCEAKGGRRLAVFLDARAAVSGQSMTTFDAAGLVADRSGALVTPVRLAGAERTMASRISAAHVGRPSTRR